jgi:chorismate synthase
MWGNHFRIAIFGESHGKAVGVTVHGLPAGIAVDEDLIRRELRRRAGGYDQFSTPRREADEFQILSGIFEGKTAGSPICCVIPNTDVRSKDYDKIKAYMRPSHADYTARVKYDGYNDYRGGGHFSGRVTAGLVVAGALAKTYLNLRGVTVAGEITDGGLDEKITAAKAAGDSVGGVVRVTAAGVAAGVGEPFFDSAESIIAHLLFSVPGVKGVEFGTGFALAHMRGSEANDAIYTENGRILTRTNHSGGINGGITNGMPLVVQAAFRPTPTIAATQDTVDITAMENVAYAAEGRHDPCIARRAVVVAESAVAIGLAELML